MALRARSLTLVLVALLVGAAAACTDDDADPLTPEVREPTANPAEGEAPLEVSFNVVVDVASARQSGLEFEWDFGDGTTSSEREPSHTYSEPGTYEVLVVVSDRDGKSYDNQVTVKVTGEPTTTSPNTPDTVDEVAFDEWAMGTNEACMDAVEVVEKIRATGADPYGPEVVRAFVEATRAEKAAIDALGVPDERAEEVQAWTVVHHDLADYFVQIAQDEQISADEAGMLQQRSLELIPKSKALGLDQCVGE
jgi:PKD repeat protein